MKILKRLIKIENMLPYKQYILICFIAFAIDIEIFRRLKALIRATGITGGSCVITTEAVVKEYGIEALFWEKWA